MDDCEADRQVEAEAILSNIVRDFDQLDRAIEAAISLLQAGNGKAEDVEALQRAREAARKGAALARSKGANE